MATAPTETAPESTMKEALKRIEDLREDLKQVLRDLNETYTLLKQLEKEKKVTEKEVEIVRAKLREIQAVKI
jgi:septal ring factor EnvC (AmiA/AmiB activator)